MKKPNTLPELLRHAADLAEKGELLQGKFEFKHTGEWILSKSEEPNFYNYPYRIADKDQHLLDEGWIRHTGDVCPVHEMTEVGWIMKGQNLLDSQNRKKIAKYLRWEKEGDRTDITHYKVIKEYVEPTTFEMKVGDKVFVLNKPYMSAPMIGAQYACIQGDGDIYWHAFNDDEYDAVFLSQYNCWRTEADAKAYQAVRLAQMEHDL